MMHIRFFKDLSRDDAGIAGGKGASLGEMTQAGIEVPPGFVITAQAFEYFLKDTKLDAKINELLSRVQIEDMSSVEFASEAIQSLILEASIPQSIVSQTLKSFHELGSPFVAVRSSATAEDGAAAAWAGQLDSFLNTTEETLLLNVQKCWASLFTPRAIFYRFEKELHGTVISVAVVVQKMIASEISGIAFSVHPISEDPNQLIIEAGFGLGEAIVSGEITPDSYVVTKDSLSILDINVSRQDRGIFRAHGGGSEWCEISPEEGSAQTLTDAEILELSNIVLTIEAHYGFPCDVEWAREGEKFYIVQSRPITTLGDISKNEPIEQALKFEKMWESLAYVFNVDQGTVLPTLRSLPKVSSHADQHWFFYAKNRGNGGAYYEEGEMQKARAAGLVDFLNKEYVRKYFQGVELMLSEPYSPLDKIEYAGLDTVSLLELRELIEEATRYIVEIFGYYLASQQQCTIGVEEKVQRELALLLPKEKVAEVFALLSTPTASTTIRDEEVAWHTLLLYAKEQSLDETSSEIRHALLSHHRKYHLIHLGDGELPHSEDYYVEKFKADQWIPEVQLHTTLSTITEIGAKIENEKIHTVAKYSIPQSITEITDMLAHMGHVRLEMRIQGWMPVIYFSQNLIKEMAKRFGIKQELLLSATCEEIFNLFETSKINTALLEERNKSYLYLIDGGQAKVYAGHEADELFHNLTPPENFEGTKEITGSVAMKGKVRGTAVLYRWGEDINAKLKTMNNDAILIAGQTRPQLMPLIVKSKGIVTDEGGITSHAAIVSRELRIPCIIGTKIATEVIKDGDFVEIDAEKGVVRILQRRLVTIGESVTNH